jgi:NTE family protein
LKNWLNRFGLRLRRPAPEPPVLAVPPELARIGIALGGGFARGVAHAGVLRVLEANGIPIHCITGVSAGAIVAAAYASGATPEEIAAAGSSMRFNDVARWSLCRLGFVASDRMERFLRRLLKRYRFEEMPLPLGVVATDVVTGHPVLFRGEGDVFLPIRASCAYPGLFRPVPYQDSLLVDGAMSMEVPAALARALGANRVVSVHLPMHDRPLKPRNMFQVVNRCFQIMQARTETDWKALSDVVVEPDVRSVEWDGFKSAQQLIESGERAATEALPRIQALLDPSACVVTMSRAPGAMLIPDSKSA